jgi:uncharacterized protein
MKVLVTGATGFIGRRVVARLVEQGHSVVALSRNPSKAKRILSYPCSILSWDGEKEPLPAEGLEGTTAVIHLAGEGIAEKRWTQAQKDKIRESRIASTRNIAHAVNAPNSSVQVVVCASAIGYYGDTGQNAVTESAPAASGFLADVCRDWEEALKEVERARVVAIRVGVVLGEGGGALQKMVPLFQKGLGGVLGSGKQWMSWIHVDDLVSLFVWAVENASVSGAVNGVAPQPVTNAAFTRALASTLGVPALLPAPAFAIRMALGEMAGVVLGSTRVLPAAAQAKGFNFRFPDLETALKDLFGGEKGSASLLMREQFIPLAPEALFPFFADATNLETLTPGFLGFKVLQTSTPQIQEGTLIDYRLKLHGVPLRWRTRIEQWQPNVRFVDTQLKGPYRYWHHTHEFIPVAGGTLMRDTVRYRLPLGCVGKAIAGRWVRKDVGAIFDYRWKKVEELFCRAPR